MSALDDLGRLRALGVAAFTTSDAAAALRRPVTTASQFLRRAAARGLVLRVRHGLWTLDPSPDPLALLDWIAAPYPAYVSLHSALHLHGLVEQVPPLVFAVTLGRSARVRTPLATYSLHHVVPEFFDGFVLRDGGIRLATPEKALVDVCYLSATRDRRFARLPELAFPRGFSRRRARDWVRWVPDARLRAVVGKRLERAFEQIRADSRPGSR